MVLTARRLAEVLGSAPPPGWLAEQADWFAQYGFVATVDERGQTVFTPLADDAPSGPEPVDVRIRLDWLAPADAPHAPGLVRTRTGDRLVLRAADDVRAVPAPAGADEHHVATTVELELSGDVDTLDLDGEPLRRLALAAAHVQADPTLTVETDEPPVMGGGSGI